MNRNAPEKRLRGARIVWTGSMDAATDLLDALTDEGAIVLRLPLIEFGPPRGGVKASEVFNGSNIFSWVVFTSIQAARFVAGYPRPEARIAAVGPGTARELHKHGWEVDLVPERHDAQGLAEAILKQVAESSTLLFVRGDKAGRTIPDVLGSHGFKIEEIEVYSTRAVSQERAREVLNVIKREADLVIAGSSFSVKILKEAAQPEHLGSIKKGLKWLCMGRKTRDTLLNAGVEHPEYPGEITPKEVVRTAIEVLSDSEKR